MKEERASAWLASALGLVALAIGIRRYYPFISDDALISLRYADRLLHGHGLTWTDGPPVEGYSDLLWVLACAALGALGIDLVDAARLLGVTGMAITIIAVAHACATRERGGLPAAAYAALAIGLAGPIAVWAVGGLEQPMVAAFLALGLATTRNLLDLERPTLRQTLVPATWLGLLVLVRPDGALFPVTIALAAGSIRLTERKSVRPVLPLVVPAFVFLTAQLAFRLAYYRDLVPNTAHAKLGGWAELHQRGIDYVLVGLTSLVPLIVVAALGVAASVRDRELRRAVAIGVIPLVTWLVYVIRIGGDIFPGHRHLVPAIVLLAFTGGAVVGRVRTRVVEKQEKKKAAYLATGLVLAGSGLTLGVFETLQRTDPQNVDAGAETWEWTCKRIAQAMGRAYGRQAPLAAVDPAGCFPYWSQLPSLDLLGLNDRFIATHPPRSRSRYQLAHDLGHPGYVLGARPDIVVLCSMVGHPNGCFPSGVGLTADPTFHRDYRLVTYELPGASSWTYWIRFADGPLSIRSTGRTLSVPAHFFTASARKVGFDDDGRAAIRGGPAAPLRIEGLKLPAGRWRVTYDTSRPLGAAHFYEDDDMQTIAGGDAFVHAADHDVDVELVPEHDDTLLYAMTLTRTND